MNQINYRQKSSRWLASLLGGACLAWLLPFPCLAQVGGLEDEVVTVEELVVTATMGPPWWRVSRGESVVYVLASPGWLPDDLTFDRGRLEQRLTDANSLILSPRWAENAFPPRVVAKALSAGVKAAPETLLDEPMRARYVAARDRLKAPMEQLASLSPAVAGMILAGEVASRRLPPTGQSVDRIAWAVAKHKRVRVIRPAQLYGRRDADRLLADLGRSGLVCLEASLAYVETPPPADRINRSTAAAAWARGDVRPLIERARDATADRHLFTRQAIGGRPVAFRVAAPECTSTMPSVLALAQRWVPDQVAAIENALRKPGHSVAVLDPVSLITKGGVLERLRQNGYQVATPNIE